MNTTAHAFVTVDMRGLKAALVARAQAERASVSVLVRSAVARDLGLAVDGEARELRCGPVRRANGFSNKHRVVHRFAEAGGLQVRVVQSSAGSSSDTPAGRRHLAINRRQLNRGDRPLNFKSRLLGASPGLGVDRKSR